MNKIWIIIKREYLTRVRKRIFIVTTVLAPVLLASVFVIPVWLTRGGAENEKIALLDASGIFSGKLENTGQVSFGFYDASTPFDSLKKHYPEMGFNGIVYVPAQFSVENPQNIEYYSEEQLSLLTESNITEQFNRILRMERLRQANITEEMLVEIDRPVQIVETNISLGDAGTSAIMGYFMGFMIYIVMLIYGTQVMRGVMEEKTNRIAEVITSSVKPFQLMMGKIVGIAFVGLTQFIIWIVLTAVVMSVLNTLYAEQMQQVQQFSQMQAVPQQEIPQAAFLLTDLQKLPLAWIALGFVFFFLTGYLLYASLFAAIGAASGDEGDQSLTFIATIPIILSILIMVSVITQPHSRLAVIASMIPLCAPVIMAARLPFVPPLWEIVLSAALLILGFLLMVWVAGKIYRTGILMYGKKGSLKEMIRWVRY